MQNSFSNKIPQPFLNTIAIFLLFIAIAFFIFQQDLLKINDLWLHNHAHDLGYPTLIICFILNYFSSKKTTAYSWHPSSKLLFFALIAATLLYISSDITLLQAPRLFAFIAILIVFITLNTKRSYRTEQILIFSILFYTIPIWGVLTQLLQTLTIFSTSIGLSISEIPATISGYYIALPGGTLEVEEGCAGLRYLVTTLLICHIFCVTNRINFLGWLWLFACGTALALIANWIRVYILTHVAYTTELQHPWVRDHEAMGWGVYLFIYFPLYFISKHIADRNQISPRLTSPYKNGKSHKKIILALSLALIAFPYILTVLKNTNIHNTYTLPSTPKIIGSCYINADKPKFTPLYSGFHAVSSATYNCTIGRLEAHFLLYHQQTQGNELINVHNELLDRKIWHSIEDQKITNRHDFVINTFVNNQGKRAITAHSYFIDSSFTTSSQQIRLAMIKNGLLTNVPAAVASTFMPCKTDCVEEKLFLENFFNFYIEHILSSQTQ